MRKLALLLVLCLSRAFCHSAFPYDLQYAWETRRLSYDGSLQGVICWTGMRRYKSGDLKEPVLHIMDLSTGDIQTQPRDMWYLIQTDYRANGTLIARQIEGKLQIAQWTAENRWEAMLEYPFVSANKRFAPGAYMTYDNAIVAYMNGYLYYRSTQDGEIYLHRDDLHGNVYTYSLSIGGPISPNGTIVGENAERAFCIEDAGGKQELVRCGECYSFSPCVWLDDDRLLAWVRMDRDAELTLYMYDRSTHNLNPYLNGNGELILYETGSEGNAGSVDPNSGNVLQMMLCGEGFYNVPTILNLTTGKPVFLAETEHTEDFDEFCEFDIAAWLIAG